MNDEIGEKLLLKKACKSKKKKKSKEKNRDKI
jgi:hypothetical protein